MNGENARPSAAKHPASRTSNRENPVATRPLAEPVRLSGFVTLLFMAAPVVALLLAPFCLVWSVPSGHVGVVTAFGAVLEDTLPPGGPYLVAPWKRVQRLNVQTTKNDEPATVPTKGGLSVELHAVLLYRLDPAKAPAVVREIGPAFEEKVIDPVFNNPVM